MLLNDHLVRKVMKALKANVVSDSTRIRRQATGYYKLTLLVKAMHSFWRQVDKSRILKQKDSERKTKQKRWFMSEWIRALKARQKQKAVQVSLSKLLMKSVWQSW
jgi:hypothetical protein